VHWGFWLSAVSCAPRRRRRGGIERVVYRPLAKNAGATALLAVFVAALGLGMPGRTSSACSGVQHQAYSDRRRGRTSSWTRSSSTRRVAGGERHRDRAAARGMLRYQRARPGIKATRVNPDLAKTIGINAGSDLT